MSKDDKIMTTTEVKMTTITYLEFYSGVGGWTMAVDEACHQINSSQKVVEPNHHHFSLSPQRLGAFDHSDLCNEVLYYNFPEEGDCIGKTPDLSTKNEKKKKLVAIERLTQKQLEQMNAFLWMMSPPCQPYTRQHDNQKNDLSDQRAKSFLHLCEMLHVMKHTCLPRIVLLENVVGFETSNSCERWRNVLKKRNYQVCHFHLNPPQLGLPNDRPRYYCIAILKEENDEDTREEDKCQHNSIIKQFKGLKTNQSDSSLNQELETWFLSKVDDADNKKKNDCDDKADPIIEKIPPLQIHTSIVPLGVKEDNDIVKDSEIQPISQFLDDNNDNNKSDDIIKNDGEQSTSPGSESLVVPQKILKSDAAWCFDIVTPFDRRSSCFTHSYGKFIRGTGSILYHDTHNEDSQLKSDNKRQRTENIDVVERFKLVPAQERKFDSNWANGIATEKLRYFSGTEIARLMGFPVQTMCSSSQTSKGGRSNNSIDVKMFSFPSSIGLKQQWKLLGNSLNVKVASKLVECALRLKIHQA